MSEYICIYCQHNNYGWCTAKKMNGLKNLRLSFCELYDVDEKLIKQTSKKNNNIKTRKSISTTKKQSSITKKSDPKTNQESIVEKPKYKAIKREPEMIRKMEAATKNMLLSVGNKLGQREMLYMIQQLASLNNGIVNLKQLSNLSKDLSMAEKAFDVYTYSTEKDKDIRRHSIDIAKLENNFSKNKKEN